MLSTGAMGRIPITFKVCISFECLSIKAAFDSKNRPIFHHFNSEFNVKPVDPLLSQG